MQPFYNTEAKEYPCVQTNKAQSIASFLRLLPQRVKFFVKQSCQQQFKFPGAAEMAAKCLKF